MDIIHRVSIASNPEIRKELAEFGVLVGDQGLVTFELDESHEAWPKLQGWIRDRGAVDIVNTKFSRREIEAARWLVLVPDWHHGYPQPNEDVFGYLEVTYDLSDYCKKCGAGKKQKGPFQMKGEPTWGRRGVLQLNWVFDEYFVTPEVWARVFKPHGIGFRVVTDRRGTELATVVQLVVEERITIATEGLLGELCTSCGRVRYLPVARGMFPPLKGEPSTEIARTREYFGSGKSSHNAVIVSKAVNHALSSIKVRGVSVKPVMLKEAS